MRPPRLLTLLAFALALLAPLPGRAAEPLDPTPRLAIMSAFGPEWTALRAAMTDPVDHAVNGTVFVTGRLEGRDVVLLLTGISMVNAAMTTQLTLDRFTVKAVLFSGIAGGVDPGLAIGDVVVPEQWGQYLEAVLARSTPEGWRTPAFLGPPPFPNYGMIFPWTVEVARTPGAAPEQHFWFPADPGLLATARSATAGLDLRQCVVANQCLEHAPKIVVGGNGVSGPAFVDNAEFRAYAFATFQARVLDMESAAVAQVAFANQVPFIAFRSLSDLAGGGEGENQMTTFFQLAADNAAAVLRAFLRALPA